MYTLYTVYTALSQIVRMYCEQVLHCGMCPQFVNLFQVGFIASNFYSVPVICCWYFTWIALGDVDLCFSLMVVRTPSVVEEETKWAMWLYHLHKQSIRVTDSMRVMSLCGSLLHKIRLVWPPITYAKSC